MFNPHSVGLFLVYLAGNLFLEITCDKNCDALGVNLYNDLKCKPVIKSGESCPSKYECEEFLPKNQSCIFQARQYSIGESVDNDLTYGACEVSCHCEDHMKFNCAVLDCPEWLGIHPGPGCYPKYEVNKCCSSGQICGPFDNITKCKGDGFDVQEGQKFSPANSCLRCVCKKGFDGKLEAPFCEKEVCATQIRHSKELAENCAPAYFSNDILCCPSTFICPTGNEKIEILNSNAVKNSDFKCKFGNTSLDLGEGFNTTINKYDQDRNMKCECILPPLVTCVQISVKE